MIDATHFWAKVEIGAPDECWPWTGEKNSRGGYGVVRLKNRARTGAHRIAYTLTTGEDPGELDVLHSCDNPPCCNPRHLRAGTHAENMNDMKERGRATSRKKVSSEAVTEIRRLYAGGVSSRAIGRQFEISQQQAHRLATGRSQHRAPGHVEPPPWKRAGKRQPGMILSDDQVAEIRALWSAGDRTQSALAKQFNVSQPYISTIVNRKDRT